MSNICVLKPVRMLKRDHIFDGMARAAGGAAGLVSGVARKVKSDVRTYVDDTAQRMDLVPREDLEALEAAVQRLQAVQKEQAARIHDLEQKITKK